MIKIYRTIILPVVLYGCETWSLSLREVHRLRVFEDRVLRGIFGPKKDEIRGERRRMHNEELYAIYSSSNRIWVIQSRIMRRAGHVARRGEKRWAYRVLVGKLRERDHLEELGVDERMRLKLIFKTWDGWVWTGLIWLTVKTGGGLL
jgi:hypothetical protein